MTSTETEAGRCPFRIEPNNDTGWLGREPTPDEGEIVQWLRNRGIPSRVLHVGVGTALMSQEFGSRVVQGLTKDGAERANAISLGLDTILCNKYDVESYKTKLEKSFDCIVDVNVRSYACCDTHFRRYMDLMLESLTPSGMLLTSRRGLDYLVPTSIAELRKLCPKWRIIASGNVVVMRPGFAYRIRRLLSR